MGFGNTAFADFAYGDGTSTFPTPPTPPNGKRRTFVTSLNVLAGTFVTGHSLLDEAGAAAGASAASTTPPAPVATAQPAPAPVAVLPPPQAAQG